MSRLEQAARLIEDAKGYAEAADDAEIRDPDAYNEAWSQMLAAIRNLRKAAQGEPVFTAALGGGTDPDAPLKVAAKPDHRPLIDTSGSLKG